MSNALVESSTTFYLGREYDLAQRQALPGRPVLYPARDLTTHAVIVGMTGSGKTGLCIDVLEEAALDGIPAIVVDPKGDITNLLLQFPDLRPADFAPWVDPDEAARANHTPEEQAVEEAARWRDGLAQWEITPDRMRTLAQKVEFAVFTPGSDAGRLVSVLATLEAPPVELWDTGEEVLRETIGATVAALLGLIGLEADPVRSREHILLSNIFETQWRQGNDLDLTQLILQINQPPFTKLGAFDVDTFFPEKDRFELAAALNGLIAAPSFRNWLEGEPLEVARLLRTPEGKPRVSIFYIAHLPDPERMFFVGLLLAQIHAWQRSQPGTTNLRALLYFDEVYGYFPPSPYNPPSKAPLLRLLKEGRAFGLGLLLVTQNPMDLDYKGLTNAGTWFIGKLQTDRDKARVLEGLEGVGAPGEGFRREDLDRLIGALDTRVFLLHNVHGDGPVVFQTRWAMSYLRGPLTRAELRRLGPAARTEPEFAPVEDTAPPVAVEAPVRGQDVSGLEGEPRNRAPLPSEIHQYYLPVSLSPEQALRRWAEQQGRALPPNAEQDATLHYVPSLLAQGAVRLFERRSGINEEQVACCLVRTIEHRALIRWEDHPCAPLDPAVLGHEPYSQATFDPPPPTVTTEKKLAALERDFVNHLYRSASLMIWYNPTLKMYSRPGQDEVEFRAACEESARLGRDAETVRLQARYEAKMDALRLRITTAERRIAALQAEIDARKSEQGWTNIESVVDVLTRRRIRRPISTGQRAQRLTEQAELNLDGQRVKLEELKRQMTDLEAQRTAEWQIATEKWFQAIQNTQPLTITPKKADIRIELFGIGWIPHWVVQPGEETLQLAAFEI